MRILLKSTFKNIIGKPFRSLLLLLAITVSSFVAMLCFDMGGSVKALVRSLYSSLAGETDITLTSPVDVDGSVFADAPDADVLFLAMTQTPFEERIDGVYEYVHLRSALVYGLDIESAVRMRLLPEGTRLSDTEVLITEDFAEQFGYAEGDPILLRDVLGEDLAFTVGGVAKKGGILATRMTMAVSEAGMERLYRGHKLPRTDAYIHVLDDSRTLEMKEYLEEKLPAADVESLMDDEEIQNSIQSITRVFYILFAICFLLVIFVTISISERIVVERMSVIGTFRSLGISAPRTAAILLLENVAYALAGSLLGCGLYCLVRDEFLMSETMFGSATAIADGESIALSLDFGEVSAAVFLGVVLGAVVVECLCPLREILRSVRIPIRDIIFANKDTEYLPPAASLPLGAILTIVSVFLAAASGSFRGALLALIAGVFALALLAPYLQKAFSALLVRIFDRLGKPVAGLAAVFFATKKSSVGAFRLCVTAGVMASLIYMLSSSFAAMYEAPVYDADLVARTNRTAEDVMFSFVADLEAVREAELLYSSADSVTIASQGREEDIGYTYANALPEGGFRMDAEVPELPEEIARDEIWLDESLAAAQGIHVGDTLEITFRADTYFPVTRQMKVAGVYMGSYMFSNGKSFFLAEDLYKELYDAYPYMLLVRTEDPEGVRAALEKYAGGYLDEIWTGEEYWDELQSESAQIRALFRILIVLGIGMTFIGVVSNQLIGYEGRRRECAVLVSAVMNRRQLGRMFLYESFFASALALVTASVAARLLSGTLRKLLSIVTIAIPIVASAATMARFELVLLAVFTLAALFPVRALKKTNLSQEIRYE